MEEEILNKEQKEKLNEMIRENNTKDNTIQIREKMHSPLIRRCVSKIQNLKRNNKNINFHELDQMAIKDCSFLYINYPNIYNKLLKNEINIKILYTFLDELELIEKGKQNQHEASYKIGLLLKNLYVDKHLQKDKANSQANLQTKKVKGKKISYEEFKEKIYN
jgi:hypothetical protein